MRVALNSAVRQVNAKSQAPTLSRVSSARGAKRSIKRSRLGRRREARGCSPRALKPRPARVASAPQNPTPRRPARSETSRPTRSCTPIARGCTRRTRTRRGREARVFNPIERAGVQDGDELSPRGDGPHKPRTHRTNAFGLAAAIGGTSARATSTLERANADVLNDRAVEARASAEGPTHLRRAEARAAEREERERTRGVRSFLETQALHSVTAGTGASTVVGGVATTIGELNAARDEALRSAARENRDAAHKSRGRDASMSSAPLGGASGRLASDRVPFRVDRSAAPRRLVRLGARRRAR